MILSEMISPTYLRIKCCRLLLLSLFSESDYDVFFFQAEYEFSFSVFA